MVRYNLSDENPSPNKEGRVFIQPRTDTRGGSNPTPRKIDGTLRSRGAEGAGEHPLHQSRHPTARAMDDTRRLQELNSQIPELTVAKRHEVR